MVAPAAALEPDKVIDLMAALEASVAAAKQARGRHPTAHDEQEDGDESAARAPATKKARARKTA